MTKRPKDSRRRVGMNEFHVLITEAFRDFPCHALGGNYDELRKSMLKFFSDIDNQFPVDSNSLPTVVFSLAKDFMDPNRLGFRVTARVLFDLESRGLKTDCVVGTLVNSFKEVHDGSTTNNHEVFESAAQAIREVKRWLGKPPTLWLSQIVVSTER